MLGIKERRIKEVRDMDKNIFERRERNFWNLMEQNVKIDTLTEEQHKTLANLANLRHQLHVSKEDLFNDESATGNDLWHTYDSIDEKLTECGLEPMGLPDYTEDFITSLDYDIDDKGLSYEEWYEEEYCVFVDQMEEVNEKIETYLRSIDEKYGTKYAPTGATRLY